MPRGHCLPLPPCPALTRRPEKEGLWVSSLARSSAGTGKDRGSPGHLPSRLKPASHFLLGLPDPGPGARPSRLP